MADVEILGELIKSAVAKKIMEKIPSAVGRTYKEEQHQGITGDAFYIVQRRMIQTKEYGSILRREYEMIVRYEPDINSQNKLEKCALMGNICMFELNSIDSGNGILIRGIDMNLEIVDGVALVYVTYPIRIWEDEVINPMGNLQIDREVIE